MKRIQFALSEEKYEKAKAKLNENGLTWQMVCDQMTDLLIMSESVDSFGLPIQEMSPSVRKKATGEIEGHFETALWKYVQIKQFPENNEVNHWMSGLKAALRQIVKSNTYKDFKRGYFFEKNELSKILDEMWDHGKEMASGHMGVSLSKIKVKKPSIDELFHFAGIEFSLKK